MPNPPAAPSRRHFVLTGAAAGVTLLGRVAGGQSQAAGSATGDPHKQPSGRVTVGVMGTSRNSIGGDGRGTHLAATLAGLPGVRVAYVCDVDSRNIPKAVEAVSKQLPEGGTPPAGVKDFRRILDDRAVDALVIAAPDHWHAPAAILACAAGKHVYVEKPCSHDAAEGELLLAAARKHNRLVQHGTQRRTWPAIREAVGRLHAGDIGRVISATCFSWADRPSIGTGRRAAVPDWLDWSLWQGPAPERPYRDNVVHYNWHWFWHWGTGELGNNGVHVVDVARWGLDVDYPRAVSHTGGKFRNPKDDQETPDTAVAAFQFGDKLLTWEHRSWAGRTPLDPDYDVLFAGEGGFLAVRGSGYALHDLKGKETARGSGDGGDATHLQNFVDAVRDEARLNAPIEQGVRSTFLCHVGNISYRTGRTLHLDPQTHAVVDDPDAIKLWGREYREGFTPVV
jgi:predicted dehydrogenase